MSKDNQQGATARVAIVTGAARGIGLGIAQRLARDGLHVIMIDVLDEVRTAAAQLSSAEGHVLDITDDAALAALVADVHGRLGRIDVLVNNAGIHPKHPEKRFFKFAEIPRADWDRVFAVDLTAPFVLCQLVLPIMVAQRWGRIVNIASRAGRHFTGSAGGHYASAKAGMMGLTRIIAGEYGPHGITANSIAPGAIATPMSQASGAAIDRIVAITPVGRMGTPDELAAAAAFLASEEAGYINGAILDVNGGVFMPS